MRRQSRHPQKQLWVCSLWSPRAVSTRPRAREQGGERKGGCSPAVSPDRNTAVCVQNGAFTGNVHVTLTRVHSEPASPDAITALTAERGTGCRGGCGLGSAWSSQPSSCSLHTQPRRQPERQGRGSWGSGSGSVSEAVLTEHQDAPQRFVSSQAGSFMFLSTFLTSFSRSLRALCSSSRDFFIFLLSCRNSWTSSFSAYTVSTRLFSSITV